MVTVRIPYSSDKRRFEGGHGRREIGNQGQGGFSSSLPTSFYFAERTFQIWDNFDSHGIASVGTMISEVVSCGAECLYL